MHPTALADSSIAAGDALPFGRQKRRYDQRRKEEDRIEAALPERRRIRHGLATLIVAISTTV
jgi:hypothetical protein